MHTRLLGTVFFLLLALSSIYWTYSFSFILSCFLCNFLYVFDLLVLLATRTSTRGNIMDLDFTNLA